MTTRVIRYDGGWNNYVHLGCSICAALSHDGSRIASSATHGQCLIRDAASGEILRRLNGHWNSVGWISWSPSDDTVASACADGSARVWNPDSGEQLYSFEAHPSTVTSVAYMPDGSQLLTSCIDGRVRSWDLESGRQTAELIVCEETVGIVVPSPDGKQLVTVSDDGKVRLFEGEECVGSAPMTLPPRYQARWSPDGSRIAVTHEEAVVVYGISPLIKTTEITTPSRPFSVDWNGDGSRLCVVGEGDTVTIVDASSGATESAFAAHRDWIWDVAWRHDRGELVTVSSDGSVAIWDENHYSLRARWGRFSRGISAVAWSLSGHRIVSSSADGHFCLWDVALREAVGEFPAHANWIRSIAWAAREDCFLTASQDGTIAIWDGTSGEEIQREEPNRGGFWDATWTPTGDIAGVTETGYVCFFRPSQTAESRTLKLEDAWLRGIAWAADDSALAVISAQGMLHVLETPNGAPRVVTDLGQQCFDCAISPDGQAVAVAVGDGTVRCFDPHTGQEIDRIELHESQVWSVEYLEGGRELLTAGADGTVRIWSFEDRREHHRFELETSCIAATLGSTGKVLFGSAGAWTLDPTTADASPGERAKTISDSPVALLDGPAQVDLLGRAPLVEELAFFLHRTSEYAKARAQGIREPDGFMLHVGGKWGAGKTSLAHDLEERVRASGPTTGTSREDPDALLRHWLPVYLSAWSAESHGLAWWSIAMAVRAQILSELSRPGRVVFRVRELWMRYSRSVVKTLMGLVALAVILFFAFDPVSDFLRDQIGERGAGSGDRGSGTSVPTLLANLVTISLPLAALIAGFGRIVSKERRRWRWPRRERSELDLDVDWGKSILPRAYLRWLRRRAGKDILLVVDDLDRCSAEFTVEMLSTLQTMVRVDGTTGTLDLAHEIGGAPPTHGLAALVLSDQGWLESSLEAHYGVDPRVGAEQGKSFGASFLEKTFIASIGLPRLGVEQRREVLLGSLGQRAQGPQPIGHVNGNSNGRVSVVPPAVPTVAGNGDTPDIEVEALRGRIARLDAPEPTEVMTLKRSIHTLDPVNRERMHVELARRMNQPEYLAKEEAQLLADYSPILEPSPRGVKRTLVGFWLNRALVQSIPLGDSLGDEEIMRWTILKQRWPALVNLVVGKGESYEIAVRSYAPAVDVDELRSVVNGLDMKKLSEVFMA
jgi:WD40 repeat protein